MVIDWLIVWGVTQAAGALVRPVLEDFAKDVVKDSAKDYVKSCFGGVFKALKKDEHQKALGKALKELVQLIDDELRNSGVPAHQTEAWADDVKTFVRSENVQTALRRAFESSSSSFADRVARLRTLEPQRSEELPALFARRTNGSMLSTSPLQLNEFV